MPIVAEFEEREYERPLYSELAQDNPQVWTPGQVLEAHLGFDAALAVAQHPIWAVLGRPAMLPGVLLQDPGVKGLATLTGVPRHRVPDYRVNLFIQAKRPSVMSYRTRGLSDFSIESPYWRFHVEEDQQSTLETIEQGIGKDAAVVYASPAFHTMVELTTHTLNRTVERNSSFVPASVLSDHSFWAYDRSGGKGYPCSEAEMYDGEVIGSRIETLSTRAATYERPAPEEAIASVAELSGRLRSGFQGMEERPPRVDAYEQMRFLLRELPAEDWPRPLEPFVEVQLLTHFTNLEWFVIG